MSGCYLDGSANIGHIDLTNYATDTPQVLMHCWINAANPNAALQYIFTNATVYNYLRIAANNRLAVQFKNAANVSLVTPMSPTLVLTPLTGWLALDVVVDTAQGFAKFYINGVLAASQVPVAGDIDHTRAASSLGSRSATTEAFIGDIFQFGYWTSFSADFVSATGELTAKYLASMYDLDQDGVLYPKRASLASAIDTLPVLMLEGDYDAVTVNSGTAPNLNAGTGTPLPLRSNPPFGNWTFTP